MAARDPRPRCLRLTIGYHGARFAGWARQRPGGTRGRPTVQALLEDALGGALGHAVRATAGGRTDAGVHAEGQVVSFATSSPIPARGLQRVLATRLPDDIWVVDVAEAPPGFDARRCAVRRWYRYAVWRAPVPPAAWRGRCLVHPEPLDPAAMRAAARHLLGRHDVAALGTGRPRDDARHRSTVRTVFAADWLEIAGSPLLLFEVCADAFLRQMVRTAVGSLLWVGAGRWLPDHLAAALASADRRRAGPTAPAAGLTLTRIDYHSPVEGSSRPRARQHQPRPYAITPPTQSPANLHPQGR